MTDQQDPDAQETTVLPVIGPELVRPYVNPTPLPDDAAPDDASAPTAPMPQVAEPDGQSDPAPAPAPGTPNTPEAPETPEDGDDATGADAPGAPGLELPVPPLVVPTRREARLDAAARTRSRNMRYGIAAVVVLAVGGAGLALTTGNGGSNTGSPAASPVVASADASTGPASGTSAAASGPDSPSASASDRPSRSASPSPRRSKSPSPSTSRTPTTGRSATSTPTTVRSQTPTSGSSSTRGSSTTLQLGSTGPAVAQLQRDLRALWIDRGLKANGTYDQRTADDVATFQVWYGVTGDPKGVYGPNSQARMAAALNSKQGG